MAQTKKTTRCIRHPYQSHFDLARVVEGSDNGDVKEHEVVVDKLEHEILRDHRVLELRLSPVILPVSSQTTHTHTHAHNNTYRHRRVKRCCPKLGMVNI
eukprot:COSAG06_NODE_2362_length_7003_cov_15.069815_11_plen_99_part_00